MIAMFVYRKNSSVAAFNTILAIGMENRFILMLLFYSLNHNKKDRPKRDSSVVGSQLDVLFSRNWRDIFPLFICFMNMMLNMTIFKCISYYKCSDKHMP